MMSLWRINRVVLFLLGVGGSGDRACRQQHNQRHKSKSSHLNFLSLRQPSAIAVFAKLVVLPVAAAFVLTPLQVGANSPAHATAIAVSRAVAGSARIVL